jgi:hypothetical protein
MDTREPPIATLPRGAPPPARPRVRAERGFARLAARRNRRLGVVLWSGLLVLLFVLSQ